MRTLTDIKRRIIIGTRLLMVRDTNAPFLVGKVRKVWKVGKAQISMGDAVLRWPAASQVRITGEHTFEISRDKPITENSPVIGYEILQNSEHKKAIIKTIMEGS